MDNDSLSDTLRQSFALKLWTEDAEEKARIFRWRGYIKHHLKGRERDPEYFNSMSDLIVLLIPYMEEMNVKLNIFWQAVRWFNLLSKKAKLNNNLKEIL